MALSELPLGYCTNVHPGQSVAEVLAGLDRYAVPVMRTVARPIAVGLWFARPVVDELLAERAKANPAGRVGDPFEFGEACAFLCAASSGFIVGQNLLLDGGNFNSALG